MEVRAQCRISGPHQLPEGGGAQHQVLVCGRQRVVGGSGLAHQRAAAACGKGLASEGSKVSMGLSMKLLQANATALPCDVM